jgi:hypothetical protein
MDKIYLMRACTEFFPEKSRLLGQFNEAFPAEAIFITACDQIIELVTKGNAIALAAGDITLPAFECATTTWAVFFLMFRLDIHSVSL